MAYRPLFTNSFLYQQLEQIIGLRRGFHALQTPYLNRQSSESGTISDRTCDKLCQANCRGVASVLLHVPC